MSRQNRKCQSDKPQSCPYHGNPKKLFLAVENRDMDAFFTASQAQEEARLSNLMLAASLRPAFDALSDIKIASVSILSDGFTSKDGVESGWVEVSTKYNKAVGTPENEVAFFVRKEGSKITVYKNSKSTVPLTVEEMKTRLDKSEKNALARLRRFNNNGNIVI